MQNIIIEQEKLKSQTNSKFLYEDTRNLVMKRHQLNNSNSSHEPIDEVLNRAKNTNQY
jgi:hypothetical protein